MDRVVQVMSNNPNPEAPQWAPVRTTLAARVAMITFLVIVGLPLLILFGVAVAVAAVVFAGLALLAAAGRRIKVALPANDGRENVRIRQ